MLELHELNERLAASSAWTAAGFLVVAYLAGIIIDAVGLAFDWLAQRNPWLTKTLAYDGDKLPADFYARVQQHQLTYFLDQWTYFSCYRNIFIMSPAWVPIALLIVNKYCSVWPLVIAILACIITVMSLVVTLRTLQSELVRASRLAKGP